MCGERNPTSVSPPSATGSSLRVRGTDLRSTSLQAGHRVIHACAGNGVAFARRPASSSGHPCVCGEQRGTAAAAWCRIGSSLRVRGTARNRRRCMVSHRVIPAYAGNGPGAFSYGLRLTGHPCVCGERLWELADELEEFGSSLRVRGTDHPGKTSELSIPVIPACAGNGLGWGVGHGAEWGHPCVCGERDVNPVVGGIADGSSLRVRGTDSVSWCAIEFSCQIQTL